MDKKICQVIFFLHSSGILYIKQVATHKITKTKNYEELWQT